MTPTHEQVLERALRMAVDSYLRAVKERWEYSREDWLLEITSRAENLKAEAEAELEKEG